MGYIYTTTYIYSPLIIENFMAIRTRLWACILYPDDGLNCDLVKGLRDLHVPVVCSPLHSPDRYPSVDEVDTEVHKKRHYHLLFDFDGSKSDVQVHREVCKVFGQHVSKPIYVNSFGGYCRYLVHLDSPDKEQFSMPYRDQLICVGGIGQKVDEALVLGDFNPASLTDQILSDIRDLNIAFFDELYFYYRDHGNMVMCNFLSRYPCKAVHAALYAISSRRYRR